MAGEQLLSLFQSPTIIGQAIYRPVVTDENGKPVNKNGAKQYGDEQVRLEGR